MPLQDIEVQGTIKKSSNPQNPYPKGSARYKLWNRREKERRDAQKPKKPKPKTPEDKSKRRKQIDDYLKDAQ